MARFVDIANNFIGYNQLLQQRLEKEEMNIKRKQQQTLLTIVGLQFSMDV